MEWWSNGVMECWSAGLGDCTAETPFDVAQDRLRARLKDSPNSVLLFESFRSLRKFSVARGYSKQGFARAKTPSTPSPEV
jgi:hypothetical protein